MGLIERENERLFHLNPQLALSHPLLFILHLQNQAVLADRDLRLVERKTCGRDFDKLGDAAGDVELERAVHHLESGWVNRSVASCGIKSCQKALL